ncbi:uncharacterized protein LOC110251701 [Exaiptasia diaphana]|uniref:UspA domain-containing protein n=1 Tax=Exaiptasia diaphana TaxID=2652724 RepID=A0A913Y3F1_EXADI|nr:uncharacterized protein LOC110251701 [Exaiptasia diaphana]
MFFCIPGYLEYLSRNGDVVLIAHCIEYPPVPEKRFPYAYDYIGEWKDEVEKLRTKAKVLLHHYQTVCHVDYKHKQINCRPIILDGHKPGQVIIEEAVNENVDAVIIGARGLGKLRRTVLGSVSDFVVHHCPVPVTVVPPESWKHHYPHHS